jgi:hypothetical protein
MRCYACKRDRDRSCFAPDRSKSSGHKSICRPCDNDKAKRYYREHGGADRLAAREALALAR